MSKDKKIKEDNIEIEEIEPEEKDRKTERFFSNLADQESFEITVYREGDRGKLELIEKYVNEIPDIISDIRNVYGGGTFRFYANRIEDGKIIERLDYTRTHIAEKINKSEEKKEPENKSYSELVSNLTILKSLMPESSGNNINEVLIAMMKTQNEISQNQTKMFNEQSERLMKFQLESEKRFSSMLEKMSEKKNPVGEIIETVHLIDSLRGSGDGDKSIIEKVLSSPLAVPILQNFLTKKDEKEIDFKKFTPEPENGKTKIDIMDYIKSIPAEMREKITSENKNDIAQKFYEKNRDILTPGISEQIMEKIIEMRDTEKNGDI